MKAICNSASNDFADMITGMQLVKLNPKKRELQDSFPTPACFQTMLHWQINIR